MVREPDATRPPTPHDNQLMSKHRVLSLKSQLRLEWQGQDGQSETEQPDHFASLGDSITSSTRIRFSVHTTIVLSQILQLRPNASVFVQGCADFPSDSSDRNHSFTTHPWRTSSSLRPGLSFRYTQEQHSQSGHHLRAASNKKAKVNPAW